MINSIMTRRAKLFLIGIIGLFVANMPVNVSGQVSEEDLRLPISLDAESTDYDGKSSMLMFKGLRLTHAVRGQAASTPEFPSDARQSRVPSSAPGSGSPGQFANGARDCRPRSP